MVRLYKWKDTVNGDNYVYIVANTIESSVKRLCSLYNYMYSCEGMILDENNLYWDSRHNRGYMV